MTALHGEREDDYAWRVFHRDINGQENRPRSRQVNSRLDGSDPPDGKVSDVSDTLTPGKNKST
jgi:hypothetical protein